MKNKTGGFISLSPILQALAWVILLLIVMLIKYMADNSYFCFDEEVCNKSYLNILP
jgi:hypothetical protein